MTSPSIARRRKLRCNARHGRSPPSNSNLARSCGTCRLKARCIGQCAGCSGDPDSAGGRGVSGEDIAACVPQHVRVNLKWHLRGRTEPCNHSPETNGTHGRPPPLRHEHVAPTDRSRRLPRLNFLRPQSDFKLGSQSAETIWRARTDSSRRPPDRSLVFTETSPRIVPTRWCKHLK
jgi:hypothetical protein